MSLVCVSRRRRRRLRPGGLGHLEPVHLVWLQRRMAVAADTGLLTGQRPEFPSCAPVAERCSGEIVPTVPTVPHQSLVGGVRDDRGGTIAEVIRPLRGPDRPGLRL